MVFSLDKTTNERNYVRLEPFSIQTGVFSAEMDDFIQDVKASIEFSMPNQDGSAVGVLIEKDFKCLVPRGEDDRHAFDNPLEGKASC